MNNPKRGFIALISVLIISVVLLVAVFSVASRGISSRFLLLDLERKTQSEQWAEGCVAVGIISVINDPLYSVASRYVPVGSGGCDLTVLAGSGNKTVEATASSTGAFTNLRVVVNASTGAVVSWRELPN